MLDRKAKREKHMKAQKRPTHQLLMPAMMLPWMRAFNWLRMNL
jgi:hypothetical protein